MIKIAAFSQAGWEQALRWSCWDRVVPDVNSHILFFGVHLPKRGEVLVSYWKASSQRAISAIRHIYQGILSPRFILQGEKITLD